jgi:hypothetical protein
MDGPTATRAIRAMGYAGRIFGVTGNGMASDIKTFMDSGVSRVMVKPFTLNDFYSALMGDAMFGGGMTNDGGFDVIEGK